LLARHKFAPETPAALVREALATATIEKVHGGKHPGLRDALQDHGRRLFRNALVHNVDICRDLKGFSPNKTCSVRRRKDGRHTDVLKGDCNRYEPPHSPSQDFAAI